jgi:uncharacterized lipoprotein YmbA
MRGQVTTFALLAALLSGCAATRLYSLSPEEATKTPAAVEAEGPARIGLLPITVAPGLERPRLAVVTDDDELIAARHHEWAEPIADELSRALQARISEALGFEIEAKGSDREIWDLAIGVEVDRLQGALRGEAQITARWQLHGPPPADAPTTHHFADTAPLREEGYAGLVAAERELVARLAVSIADSVRDRVAADR